LVELVETTRPSVELVETTRPSVELVETMPTGGDPQAAPPSVAERSGSRHRRDVPHAYILECSDGSYYLGSTWDLERRVGEHNLGLGAEYTKRRGPVRLVWAAEFNRIDEAYAVER
jgi:hypothetical protein